jgi:outer membrane protein assembly factor BamC
MAALVLLNLSACTYIRSLFPDKEKDYQYTTEIPPLILPEDLKKSQIPSMSSSNPAAKAATSDLPVEESSYDSTKPDTSPKAIVAPESAIAAESTTTPVAISPENQADNTDIPITVQHIRLDGKNILDINAPVTKSWRLINKALSRNAIEVIDRNLETKLFTVRFKAENEPIEKDSSYWHNITSALDEVKSVLGTIKETERVYLIKLDENNQQTNVSVLDENKNLLSDPDSVKLLSVLEDTLKKEQTPK